MSILDIEVKARMNEDVVDIPTMRTFDKAEYLGYMQERLFFTDHHGVLRSTLGEWPVTVTKTQVRALIEYLQSEVLPAAPDR